MDNLENPFLDSLGIRLVRWEPSLAEFSLALEERHLNRQQVLQGGVIATLLDAACGYAGLFGDDGSAPLHASTLSLSVSFVAALREGALRAVGRRSGGGRNIFFSEGQLFADDGKLVATAQGVFKYRTPARTDRVGAEHSFRA